MESETVTSFPQDRETKMTEEERGLIGIYARPALADTLAALRSARTYSESEYRSLLALYDRVIRRLSPLSEPEYRALGIAPEDPDPFASGERSGHAGN